MNTIQSMRAVVGFGLLLALASPTFAFAATDEDIIKAADRMVAASLKDPDAAKFTGEVVVRTEGKPLTVCGRVNGKNGYGAYVGAKWFFVQMKLAAPELTADQFGIEPPVSDSDLLSMRDRINFLGRLQDICK